MNLLKSEVKKSAIFIDFDHTLFDCDLFFHVEVWDMVRALGVSRSDWERSYEAVWQSGYSLIKHIDELRGILPIGTLNRIKQLLDRDFLDLRRFLFADVLDFLNSIPRDRYDVHLLSFGFPEWQIYKVTGSGLVKYFDGLFFTLSYKQRKVDKIYHLAQSYAGGIIIDNSPLELDAVYDAEMPFNTILINRVPEHYANKHKEADYRFCEAAKYLQAEAKHKHEIHKSLMEIAI